MDEPGAGDDLDKNRLFSSLHSQDIHGTKKNAGGDPVGDAGALAFTRGSGRAARALF